MTVGGYIPAFKLNSLGHYNLMANWSKIMNIWSGQFRNFNKH